MIKSGVVVFEGDVQLPEGTAVQVVAELPVHSDATPAETVWDRLRQIAGTGSTDLPGDASVNIDHYLYGTISNRPASMSC